MAAGAGMTALGAGLLDQTKSMIAAGATFQQEMQFINTLAGGTAQTSQMLQDEATKLDRTTVFSLQDISQGMEQLAREGFTPLQIAGTNATNSLIQNSANMAAALRINMQDASNMLGMTMRAYQEDVSQTAQVTDILTEAALRSGKSADEFNTQLQYVEATAHQLGIPLQDIAAATGELMSQNVPGAGQGLRAFLVGITSEGSTANKELTKLGISAYDAQGKFVGLPTIIDELNTALSKLSPSEQSAAIKALSGGNRQVTALIQLLKDGSSGLTDFEQKMGSLGSAANVMSTLMNTAAGSFKAFMSSLETAKILIGESFLPLLRPVTDGLREVLGAFIQGPAVLHAFAAAAIAASGVLLTLAGGMSLFKALGMKATLGEMVAGLTDVAGTMLPVIALAGAFYLAWEHNFLGFQSLVRGVVSDVQTFADAFGKVFGTNLRRTDPLSAVLASASWGAAAINLQGLSRWFDQLAVSSHAVWLQFSSLAQQVMPSLNAAWRELGLANDHVVTAVQDLLRGDLPGALRNWRAAITETQFAWTDFSHALGIVGSNITSLIQTVGSWVLKVGIPKVEGDIAGIASAVWDWVQNTAWPAVQDAARDLGSLAVKVGHWLVSAGEDLVQDVQDWWNKYKIGALVHDYGMELTGLAVRVGGWLPKEAENLSAKVWSWVTDTLWPGVKSAVTELGGLAISVGSWAVKEAESLSAKVWSWITDTLWPGVKGAAAELGGIAISVSGWLVREGESLSAKVWSWITDVIWPGVQNVSTTLGGLAITVSNWAEPIIEGLWDKVSNAIQVSWESNSGSPVDLPTVDVNVGKFKVHVDAAALFADVNKQIVPSKADLAGFAAAGKSSGAGAADAYFAAFLGAFNIFKGGAGGPQGAANESVILAFPQTFFNNFRDGVESQLKKDFANWHIQVPEPYIDMLAGKGGIAAGAANPFQVIQTQMELQGLKLGEWFKNLKWTFSLPKISITPPSTGDLDLIPGIGPAFAQALGSFSTWVSGLKFSVGIPKPSFTLPTIGLPDFGGLMASVVSGLGSVGDAIKNFKLSFDIPKPSFNWPSIDLVSEAVKHFVGAVGGVIHVPIKFVIDFIQGQSDKKSPSTGGGGQGNDSLSAIGGTSVSGSGSGGVGNVLNQFGAVNAQGAAIGAVLAGIAAAAKNAAAQVAGFGAALRTSMEGAVSAVTSAGAGIRAAASLIGLSLAASGRSAGQQFAQGLGLGALQAAADMAQAAGAIMAVASMIVASLTAAGTSAGNGFAVGIGLGALLAAADMASAGAAIEGIAASITGALAAAGAAAGASFAAGIGAGMAVAEGAAAAGVGAIVAICSAVDLFGAGFATGASFGAGVAAGLASEEGAVAAEASAIVASAAAASAAAAQIHSPSRLFRDKIGVPIAQGIAVGIREGATFVQDAARGLISLPTLPSTYNASGAISGPAGGIVINPTINVNVDGSYAGSVDELAAKVSEKIGPVLVHVATQLRRGQGALR